MYPPCMNTNTAAFSVESFLETLSVLLQGNQWETVGNNDCLMVRSVATRAVCSPFAAVLSHWAGQTVPKEERVRTALGLGMSPCEIMQIIATEDAGRGLSLNRQLQERMFRILYAR